MYCNKCGKEIMDEAVICVHCGCAVNGKKEQWVKEDVNRWLCLLSFLIPLIGFILAIVKYCDKKTSWSQYLLVAIVTCAISVFIIYFTGLIS